MSKLKARIEYALQQNANIVVSPDQLKDTTGFELEYLESLGITKSDLKRLERYGLAVRGYIPYKTGRRVRWFLMAPGNGGTDGR